MTYVLVTLAGVIGGAVCVYMAFQPKAWKLEGQRRRQEAEAQRLREAAEALRAEQQDLDARAARLREEHAATQARLDEQLRANQQELDERAARLQEEHAATQALLEGEWRANQGDLDDRAARLQEEHVAAQARRDEQSRANQRDLDERAARLREEHAATQVWVDEQLARLKAEREQFETRVISYNELQDENTILKRDLQNMDVTVRKLELDRDLQREAQQKLDERSRDLGSRYLKDNVKWISSSLTPNNFVNCKDRLHKVIEWCRGIGFDVPTQEEGTLVDNLRKEFEAAVRAAFEREEQARIKARIREEQMLEREVERELKQLERERAAIQAALDKALAEAEDKHSEEIERLRSRLAEAEEKSQRAISQAQMTKSGHVYVISNIGSFGEGVYKIGVTRRLEPMERVKELGDASVPFPFDVHMMIASDDAPTLENALHRTLHKSRINKINPRKEFFKTDVEAVRRIVEEHHGEVQYVADAEALQYRQSLAISEEDQEYIEHVYDELDEESKPIADDQ